MEQRKKKKKSSSQKRPVQGTKKRNTQRPAPQQESKAMIFLQNLQKWMFVGLLVAVVYVVFFMPAGTGTAPVDQGGTAETNKAQEFNLYTYLNGVTSASGNVEFDCEFSLDNGDILIIETSKKFETRGSTSSIKGSTIYNLNDNAGVLDNITYLKDGYRYEKGAGGYCKTAYKPLDGGNLNLSTLEEELVKSENTMKEDGIACYKYTTSTTYGAMSNELRNFVRSQNVNVSDIDNVMVDISLFVTEGGVPYKAILTFKDVRCMIKASGLVAKNGVAAGSVTITFSGFNNVKSIDIPADVTNAPDGSYTFTDGINRYLGKIGAMNQ